MGQPVSDAKAGQGERKAEAAAVADQAAQFLSVLTKATCVTMVAGGMVQQTRGLFVLDTAAELGESAVALAKTRLAAAASAGSFLELLIGPTLGTLSDRVGRRPVFLFYAAVPAITRALAALPGLSVNARLTALYTDMALLRCCGVQPMMTTGQTMISDVCAPAVQTLSRSRFTAAFALGIILGSFGGGRMAARFNARTAYTASVLFSLAGALGFAALLPETHVPRPLPAGGEAATAMAKAAEEPAQKRGSPFSVLARDPECRLLALTLALHEFCQLAQFNDVHILWARETLKWGPAENGLFAAIWGVAQFVGNMATTSLVELLGPAWQVSFSHASLAVAFSLWGCARHTGHMAMAVPALVIGFGRTPVLLNRLYARAGQLGLGKGETTGAFATACSFSKMVAPLALMQIYMLVGARRARGRRGLPSGAPMLVIASLALLAEALHQRSLREVRLRKPEA